MVGMSSAEQIRKAAEAARRYNDLTRHQREQAGQQGRNR